jgi:hypothetical protein
VLTSNEISFDLLAVQEHHLVAGKWSQAQHDLPSNLRAVTGPARATKSGGSEGGVAFIFSPTLPVAQVGALLKGPRWLSLELYGVTYVSFYAPQHRKEAFELLSSMFETLLASRKPFVILGDFTCDVSRVQAWLNSSGHLSITAVNFGPTCSTHSGKTAIGFTLLCHTVAPTLIKYHTQATTLATHDTLHLYFDPQAANSQYAFNV